MHSQSACKQNYSRRCQACSSVPQWTWFWLQPHQHPWLPGIDSDRNRIAATCIAARATMVVGSLLPVLG